MKINRLKNMRANGAEKSIKSPSSQLVYVRILAVAIAGITSSSYAVQSTDYIEAPKYETMDRYQVNVVGNQVSPTIQTVAIGGELGLQHSITPMGNAFNQLDTLEFFRDKYSGGIRTTELSGSHLLFGNYYLDPTAMRASFLGQQAEFWVFKNNGAFQAYNYGGTDYYYEALGDKRHTLERRTDGLVWTQPDGTEVYFSTGDETVLGVAKQTRAVKKIVYPNGFTIKIGSMVGVGATTNTGYGLKYNFDFTDSLLEPSKRNRLFPDYTNVPKDIPEARANFWGSTPSSFTAVNTAIDACRESKTTPCSEKWPKATLSWPSGMPRAIYIDKSTFSVTNAAGVRTDFIYQAFDAVHSTAVGCEPGRIVSPRLVEIKQAGAIETSVTYTYQNQKPPILGGIDSASGPYCDPRALITGILSSATGVLGDVSYGEGDLRDNHGKSYGSNDIAADLNTTNLPGTLENVTDMKTGQTVYFIQNFQNFVQRETFGGSPERVPDKIYGYDARGNLTSITQGPTVTLAEYPATCTNPKTCNQPIWVKDRNGNKTSFTYHPESGQVATVTSPANRQNKIAQTRYTYDQYFANYYHSDGVKRESSEGIWLKTTESYCANSNYTNGNCEGNDEVVTTYEYDHDNLHMTAMIIRAKDYSGGISEKRTCYEYDIYGNRVSETAPKGTGTSCPAQ